MLTLPVFARALDSAEYGALELYTVGIAVAIVFVDAGMSAAAQRSFYDYRDEQLTDRRARDHDGLRHVDRRQRGSLLPRSTPRATRSRTGSSRGNRIPASSRLLPSRCRCSQSRT